jgi:carbonic anhydrase/acetyltransferase-like protein (isoleucine patch superfamily)
VEVGPFAIVRGSVLGNRVKVDPYCTVGLSVIGDGARVGRMAMVNLCVVYPGAFVSEGGGWQMCVIGRDAFCAKTATVLDLSFGKTIRSPHGGAKADTEVYFLGAAIGHRARVGAGVRICYGASVPNDVLLVAPPDTLFRTFPEGLQGALTVRDGVAVPVESVRTGR